MMIAAVTSRSVYWVLGNFLAILTVCLLLPLGYTLVNGQADPSAFIKASAITMTAAAILLGIGFRRERRDLFNRESLLLVALIWICVCLFGSLPFYFSSSYPTFSDAVFEATSGFTTTGATVIADVDGLSRPLHLWRSLSHWLGGMGIVLLGLAILPLLSHGGGELYRAEFSGASSERMRPRIMETARALWRLYVLLTLVQTLLLMAAGMSAFEAICHAFSTLGTGGFSTRTESIAGFHNIVIEYITILFMFLAGVSFIQHFRLWVEHNPRAVMRDHELKTYALIALAATLVIAWVLHEKVGLSAEASIRSALFQVVSILSTTGFVSADYATWPAITQLILLLLMFIGGCTGSTAGGLKVFRTMLILKVIQREFHRMVEPQGVFRIRIAQGVIAEPAVSGLINLVFLALLVLSASSLVVSATGVDIVTSVSSVIACQFNIGPGLGAVGPVSNYAELHPLAKWVLSFCMIAGRLEFYTLLVLMTRAFWSR